VHSHNLPISLPIAKIKMILQKQLNLANEICIQVKSSKGSLVNLEDDEVLRDIDALRLEVSYKINLIFRIDNQEVDL
jgi:hypothetical protein